MNPDVLVHWIIRRTRAMYSPKVDYVGSRFYPGEHKELDVLEYATLSDREYAHHFTSLYQEVNTDGHT